MAITIPCNTGKFQCRTPRGPVEFHPHGGVTQHGSPLSSRTRGRSVGWTAEGGVYSALVLVGLSVDGVAKSKLPVRLRSMRKPHYSSADVVKVVKAIRAEQAGDPSSSFILQKGVYKHKSSGEVITEDSVRIILLHLTEESKQDFRAHVIALAEELCERLHQEEVIVEFQDAGVTKEVLGIHSSHHSIRGAQ